ncbi:pantothenate kinase [Bacillus oleivorans]|uniref:Pantothenate kinase n=1 Tax=Bacillus oleivorans TaxID=1448271 RepID=A0A285D5W6_9BACI|nr:type II pantothenate kinase [Bacillus oleivorans]SNX74736.1 pantothenate kinase [Bacillus oleivorans]
MKTIGIDAGGSLLKVVYEEQGSYHYKWFPIAEMDQAVAWLQLLGPLSAYKVTGGKAHKVQEKLAGATVTLVPEFDSVCIGTRELLIKEKIEVPEKYLIISIGTGTSFYIVEGDKYQRLFGSGIGGGTINGLSQLLLKEHDFTKVVELAQRGKRGTVDLLVKDLYEDEEPPLPGDLTAANFGKPELSNSKKEDVAAALFQMIGETLLLLAKQFASPFQVQKFVYVGSAVANNPALQQIISSFDGSFEQESIFIDYGSYAGAIGAITYQS